MSVIKIVPTDFFLSNVLINILAIKRKAKIAWLPITFLPRKSGSNSIKILGIFKIGLKAVRDLYKIKRTIKADPEFS
jgi:hypothetical protein